jgi:dihydrofolate reductase/thymidylate synthase
MDFNFVACVDKCYGIAKDGEIPWKLQEDSDYFRDLIKTKYNGKPNIIVTGRKTFEKMGVIKDHYNIVFTRNIIGKDSIIQVHNEEDFFSEISDLDYGKIFICGGADIYNIFCKYIGRENFNFTLYLNMIYEDFKCDTILPKNLIKYCSGLCYDNSFDMINRDFVNMYSKNLYDEKFYNFICCKPVKLKYELYEKIIPYKTENHEEQKYIDVMKDILMYGTRTHTRNGVTTSKFGTLLEFDLKNGFPLLTTKKMFFKGVCEELLFFLRGETNAKNLSNKGVKIWDKNTDRTFLDENGFSHRFEGDMGPMYGFQWRHFNAEYSDCNSDYNEKGLDQLVYVLKELKENPHSRRIIMTTYNPLQAKEGVLFPCHGISIQFNVTEVENKYVVNLSQNQRSADYFLGLPFNIASYALLLEMVCHHLNNKVNEEVNKTYVPGKVILFLGDYHIYLQHYNQCIRQILRYPIKFPKIKLNPNKRKLEDFQLEDFEIIGYNSYPGIVADIVA